PVDRTRAGGEDIGPFQAASTAAYRRSTRSWEDAMSVTRPPNTPKLPPRRFVRGAWSVHRALYRVLPGKAGLWGPRGPRWGTMRVTATGRKSGQPRSVILGYVEDGDDLVTLAITAGRTLNRRGGSTCKPTRKRRSSSSAASGGYGRARRPGRSATGSGRGGATTSRSPTSTPHSGTARPRWSCSSPSGILLAADPVVVERRHLRSTAGEVRLALLQECLHALLAVAQARVEHAERVDAMCLDRMWLRRIAPHHLPGQGDGDGGPAACPRVDDLLRAGQQGVGLVHFVDQPE